MSAQKDVSDDVYEPEETTKDVSEEVYSNELFEMARDQRQTSESGADLRVVETIEREEGSDDPQTLDRRKSKQEVGDDGFYAGAEMSETEGIVPVSEDTEKAGGEESDKATAVRSNDIKVDTNSMRGITREFGSISIDGGSGPSGGVQATPIELGNEIRLKEPWFIPIQKDEEIVNIGLLDRMYRGEGWTMEVNDRVFGENREMEDLTEKAKLVAESEGDDRVPDEMLRKTAEEHRESVFDVQAQFKSEWQFVREYVRERTLMFIRSGELAQRMGGKENLVKAVNQIQEQIPSSEVNRELVVKRLAEYMMDPIELPGCMKDESGERTTTFDRALMTGAKSSPEHYAGNSGEQAPEVYGGDMRDIDLSVLKSEFEHMTQESYTPDDFLGKVNPAFEMSADVLKAGEKVMEDLVQEVPSNFKTIGDPQWQSTASVRGEVVNIFEPKAGNQKQVFMMKDENNEFIKVTIWNESDHERYGMQTLGMGAADWSDGQNVPVVHKGDVVEIKHGVPSTFNGQKTLAVTQESMLVRVEENDDGEAPVDPVKRGSTGVMQDYGSGTASMPHSYENDSVEDFDVGEAVPLSRVRPRDATLVRQGHFTDAETLGIGNMAFMAEVAYDGSYNHGASDEDGSPSIRTYDGPSTFARTTNIPDELPVDASELPLEDNDFDWESESDADEVEHTERVTDVEFEVEIDVDVGAECPDCGSKENVHSVQMQHGGADEGFTAEHQCECGCSWSTGY